MGASTSENTGTEPIASSAPNRTLYVCPVKGCGARSLTGSCPNGH